MEVKSGDRFVLHSEDGDEFEIRVINVNEYREPDMKCACDIFRNGVSINKDVWFCGEDFLLGEDFERIQEDLRDGKTI